ncbi:MAG: glycosyltransferase family 39 protein [Chloroflexota bacterium]|nr:glycosyltransferase family 39 protein [Chloroflexota bacterium]
MQKLEVRTQKSGGRPFCLLLVAFVLMGMLYSVTTPFFEASDELWHYPMVKRFADGKGLPVQDPETETEWRQEGGQPPLYYMLMAVPTFWINTEDMRELQRYNPHSYIGRADRRGNRNIIIHTDRERFPWEGTVLAVHIIRILSVLLQSTTVLGIYLLSLEIIPDDEELALAAASLTAFVPMILFISASVNNDNLIVPIATWTVLLLVRMVKHRPSWRRLLIVALLVGLGGISKMSGPGLLPLSLIVIAVMARRRRDRGLLLRGGGLVTAGFLLLAGWFYWRNWRLYFDPSGWSVWLQFGHGAREELPWLKVLREWGSFRDSYWALFGGVNVQVHEWIYSCLDLLVLVALAGLILSLVRARRKEEARRVWSLLWVPLLWLVLIMAGLFIWTSLIEASQGRLIFPATSSVSLLLAYGLSQWVPRRWHGAMAASLAGGFLAFALACPFIYIMPTYRPPQPITLDQVPEDLPLLDITFGDRMRLVAGKVKPGPYHLKDEAQVTLCWQCLREMDRDWSVFIHLFGRERDKLGQTDIYPTLGLRPTSFWEPGDVYCDTYDLPLKKKGDVPVLARVEVGLYDCHSRDMKRLPPISSTGERMEWVEMGRIKVIPRRWPEYKPEHSTDYSLGGLVTLTGYDLEDEVEPEHKLDCTLYWQVERTIPADYTVFNHLLGPDGRMWGQWDEQPLGGDYPTSAWAPGEVIRDEYEIPVQKSAPPGQYQLEVGMYLLETGERLPVSKEESPISSRILLKPVEVVR